MRVPEHLNVEDIYELIEGRLEPNRERLAEAHLWRCARCRALHEDCGALLDSLHWYSDSTPGPPEGYWDDFWSRWPLASRPLRRAVAWPGRVAPAVAAAAAVALLVGLWWTDIEDSSAPVATSTETTTVVASPVVTVPVADPDLADDYEFFERVTVAVGSVDPASKGVALASLIEGP